MAVVKMHQAKDGSLHKTAALCAEHNIQLRLAPAIDAFVNKVTPDEITELDGVPALRLIDLPEFLVKNSTELRKLLNDALIERKPRKKGATQKANTPAPTPKVEAKPEVPVNPPADVGGTPDPIDDVLADLGA